eukprot:1393099-Amorphochlora_amoeboformis.AAC.1
MGLCASVEVPDIEVRSTYVKIQHVFGALELRNSPWHEIARILTRENYRTEHLSDLNSRARFTSPAVEAPDVDVKKAMADVKKSMGAIEKSKDAEKKGLKYPFTLHEFNDKEKQKITELPKEDE